MGLVEDAFLGLKSNLEITQTEQDLAKSRHKLIRDHIREHWTLSDDFLTGSYDRHTKTKHLKDVDIFVVIDSDGPQASLQAGPGSAAVAALRKVLELGWDDVDSDDSIVRVNYAGEDVASYEVAPVFARAGGGYLMPRGGGWMATDPTKHADMVTKKNAECDGGFVPMVKMLKGINREAGEPIRPSFLIEVMALELVLPPFDRYPDEIRFFLASAAEQLTSDWRDPAELGDDVNAHVAATERAAAAATCLEWQRVAEEALLLEGEGRERAAVDRWRSLFGWRMPRP